MKIKTKLILLILSSITALTILSGFLMYSERNKFTTLFYKEAQERNIIFDRFLRLRSSSLKNFVRDYALREEMIVFLITGDKRWASHNLDSGLSTFEVNALWVYRDDLSLLYCANNLDSPELNNLPLFKPVINKLFEKDRFAHFFLNTYKGLMEVCAAAINQPVDYQEGALPQGYFFVGRLWDKDYLSGLSRISGSKIDIVPVTEKGNFEKSFKPKEGIIAFSRILTGWDKKPLMRLDVRIESVGIRELNRFIRINLIIPLIFATVILLVILLSFRFWISNPLKLFSRILATEDPAYLNQLQRLKNEFGDISRLIHRFFEQKTAFVKEIEQRKQIEEDLNKQHLYLEGEIKNHTAELQLLHEQLRLEIAHRKQIEQELNKEWEHMEGMAREHTAQMKIVNEQLQQEDIQHRHAEEELTRLHKQMEELKETRIEELKRLNEQLQQEISRRIHAKEQLQHLEELTEKQLGELRVINGNLQQEISRGKQAEEELKKSCDNLQGLIEARTAELNLLNVQFQQEAAQHRHAEEELNRLHQQLEEKIESRTSEMKLVSEQLRREVTLRSQVEAQLEELKESRTSEIQLLNEQLQLEITHHKQSEEELQKRRRELEEMMKEHAEQLRILDEQLQKESWQRKQVEEELNKQLKYLGELRETQAAELELLNAQLQQEISQHKKVGEQLQKQCVQLDEMVKERTDQLRIVNAQLQQDSSQRKELEEALRKTQEELERRIEERTAELMKANEALQAQICERKRADDSHQESK